jgi:hypothetical protein
MFFILYQTNKNQLIVNSDKSWFRFINDAKARHAPSQGIRQGGVAEPRPGDPLALSRHEGSLSLGWAPPRPARRPSLQTCGKTQFKISHMETNRGDRIQAGRIRRYFITDSPDHLLSVIEWRDVGTSGIVVYCQEIPSRKAFSAQNSHIRAVGACRGRGRRRGR